MGKFSKGAALALSSMMKESKERGEKIGDLDNHTTDALITMLNQANNNPSMLSQI
jgi:hypothetical protein